MSWHISVLLVALALGKGDCVEQCAEKFRNQDPIHSACLPPPQGLFIPSEEGVTEADEEEILRAHNEYRRNVQPPATNMLKMYWDDELAMVAQKWASNCKWGHDKGKQRSIPGRMVVGQNLALGHRNFTRAIRAWYNEVNLYTYGEPDRKRGYKKIGHYTQVVWATSNLVGCGYAKCNETKNHYVCNYGPAGNYKGKSHLPYVTGTPASSCPNSAQDGLCDCGTKSCMTGGKLNIDTCECECKYQREWINQDDCSVDCSKAKDRPHCGKTLLEENCKSKNIPFNYCPVMCGICPQT